MASLVYEDFPGTTTEYKVNFEYLERSDVYVGAITEDIEGVEILTPITQGWSWKDDTTIEFTQTPGGVIRIYRVTNVDENYSTFYPTVAIRALDLNNNQDQAIFAIQELQSNQKLLDEKYEDIRGPEGPAGPEGPTGPDGPTGPKGEDGINLGDGLYDPNSPAVCDTAGKALIDADGDIWVCDGQGTWVNSGPVQGPQGAQGPSGPSGSAGVQGEQGIQGIQGPQGFQGVKGDTGENGADGEDGATGATGKGFTGGEYDEATGQVIFTSDDGLGFSTTDLRSIAFNYTGNVPTVNDLPNTGNNEGDFKIVEDTGEGYVWNGTQWNLVGNIRGPEGPEGPEGTAATITVKSTSTSAAGTNAAVSNDGTANAAELVFQIPRGQTGAEGPQGIEGPQGPQGPQGDTPTGPYVLLDWSTYPLLP